MHKTEPVWKGNFFSFSLHSKNLHISAFHAYNRPLNKFFHCPGHSADESTNQEISEHMNHDLTLIHENQTTWTSRINEYVLLTGLCRIMETLFLCSIMLKSCRRSGAMFLSLWYSGLLSSTRSKYRSLWGAVVGGGAVTTPAPDSPFILGWPPVTVSETTVKHLIE